MEQYLKFYGTEEAENFSKVVNESFKGMENNLFVWDKKSPIYGYCYQALEGYEWRDSMWSRDMGTLLREFTLYGHMDNACALAEQLMKRVGKNDDGYYAYPRYFTPDEYDKSGDEVDGTATVVIGLILLWERLDNSSSTKKTIYDFLICDESPIRWILKKLENQKLIAGTGEFGSGLGIETPSCNSVQNNLLRLVLIIAARFLKANNFDDLADKCEKKAAYLEENICKYLIKDGKFIWCIDPETLEPDEKILNAEINRGITFVNGVLIMCEDVLGLDFADEKSLLYKTGENTFFELLEHPLRKELYEKHGMYMQFDEFWKGFTGPSYGHGYAMQAATLLKRKDMLARMITYLTNYTMNPDPMPAGLVRESPYWLFERYYVPEALDYGTEPAAGCGPLTIVCVTEILKAARLIAGIDHVTGKISPTLPDGWTGFEAKGFPVLKDGKTVFYDITYTEKDGAVFTESK